MDEIKYLRMRVWFEYGGRDYHMWWSSQRGEWLVDWRYPDEADWHSGDGIVNVDALFDAFLKEIGKEMADGKL